MLYMVIERFVDARAIYRRLDEKGRLMPEGLSYISSWIDQEAGTCWQVMQTENPDTLRQWMANWDDLMEFEVVPVYTAAETRARSAPSQPPPRL